MCSFFLRLQLFGRNYIPPSSYLGIIGNKLGPDMKPHKNPLSKAGLASISYIRKRNPLETLPLNKWATTAIVLGLAMLLLSILFTLFLPPEIPLFYGASEPKDQIAKSWNIVIPSLVALLGSALNLLLAIIVKSDFLKKTLVIASVALSLLTAVTTLKIFFLVASF